MNIKEAKLIKNAVRDLFHTEDGKTLISLLERVCGLHVPVYNEDNQTSITLAAGRLEVLQTLMSLDKCTAEQINHNYNGDEPDVG